jgi:hypothetical protein
MARDMPDSLITGAGLDMDKNPAQWDLVARSFGKSLPEFYHALYDWSSRTLWAANDMMYTQRYLELKDKGYSPQEAIKSLEKDFPNYRIPPKILKSRVAAQLAQEPSLFAFMRYHFGVYAAYGHMAKDLIKGTPQEQHEALGKLAVMGLLGLLGYPLLDTVAQAVTGNPEAEQRRRGPFGPASHVQKVIQGKDKGGEDIGTALRSVFTPAPLFNVMFETLANRDWAGRKVVENTNFTNPSDALMGATQFMEHLLTGLVSPFGTVAAGDQRKQGFMTPIRDAMLDIRNPSEKSVQYANKQAQMQRRAEQQRAKHPHGPIERAVGGWLRGQ